MSSPPTMEPSRAPKSPPFLKKSTTSLNPCKTQKSPPLTPFLVSLAFLFLTTFTTATSPPTTTRTSDFPEHDYATHCNNIVPQSPITGTRVTNDSFIHEKINVLHFNIAHFTGGSQIIPKQPESDSPPVSLNFLLDGYSLYQTENPFVVKLKGSLKFRLPPPFMNWKRQRSKQISYLLPRTPLKPGYLVFDLYGFWSLNSGKLCMVGSGRRYKWRYVDIVDTVSSFSAVFKVNYTVGFSDFSSLINGVLQSSVSEGGPGYFEPISILGIPHFGPYKYTLVNKINGDVAGFRGDEDNGGGSDNLPIESVDSSVCFGELFRHTDRLELEYAFDCSGKCNPLGASFDVLPRFMTIQGIRCHHERERGREARILIRFSNSAFYQMYGPFGGRSFDPNATLIGEGVWDNKRNRLFVIACHLLSSKDLLLNASIGDCSIQLTLRFPRTLTIRNRSLVVGQISSNKTVNDIGCFASIGVHGSDIEDRRLPGLKYEYTMLEKVHKSCARKKGNGKRYPNGFSPGMRFDMSVRNGKGQETMGFSTPLFVGDQQFEPYQTNGNSSGFQNISYRLEFFTNFLLLSNESGMLSAEGTYDIETGVLCMLGCRHLITPSGNSSKNDSIDCEILVNVHFSPLQAKGQDNIKGTIESMRKKSDPLYFPKLEITSSSMYTDQAAESIWRMDMEIALVLISNTFACVFVGLQLYHVKNHPNVLPFISFLMLLVLTLGYMVPLLLNFEALLVSNHNRKNVFLDSGGWLEVNEIAVRVVTMVAFLLIFRLLLLTWSSRQNGGSHKSLWLSEKKVLYLSLPLYIVGGLFAWYVHQWKNSYKSPFRLRRHRGYQHQQHYPWTDLKSYAGLVLDGFLLPQIIFNLFLNSRENTLASPFYVGTTVVRLLPHAYDLYRAHISSWYLDFSYIYANHGHDFYSTAWDIIIPFGGLLFAAVIYLQQRFGGCCIVPKRFREAFEYEKIPMVRSEELQELQERPIR